VQQVSAGIIPTRRVPGPVTKNRRRRCLHCRHLFYLHPRTRTQRRFYSAPACRAALATKARKSRLLPRCV